MGLVHPSGTPTQVSRPARCRAPRRLQVRVEAFVVDDTGFPKKGEHSVGVARQYSGTLGRTDNCQVAVSLHLAGDKGSECILMGVQGTHKVWPPGAQPRQPPKVAGRKGRPRTRYTAQGVEPWSIESLARELPEEDWHSVHWREGSRGQQSSRFAAVRVRSAARHVHGVAPGQEEWLLVEWPKNEEAPTKYALCSLPADTALKNRAATSAFPPLSRTPWTLPQVRRRLQHLLLQRIGHCPLCLRHVDSRAPSLGPSRI
ncbi:transposase [Archangium violaceum]|uniref:transposase n=1 Tax=Archangium violaceum TaxID=83451 RepID=UPI0036D8B88D